MQVSTHRHSPWFTLVAAFAVVLGLVIPAANAEAAKYPYTAPPTIAAVNSTKTSVELFWRTVTGAPAYRLRAVGGGKTLYQDTGSDGSAVFKGLASGTAYTFNVAVLLPGSPAKLVSSWSKAKASKATTAATMLEAPTALKMTAQTHASLTFTWTLPAGFDPSVHRVKLDYAEDQPMTTGGGSQVFEGSSGTLTGLAANTNFFVRASVVDVNGTAVGDRSTAVLGKTRSPMGFIKGKVSVSGGSDDVLSDYVAAAYSVSTGDVNKQVPLVKSGSDWTYTLEVRPGAYYVQISNVGTSNTTSLWAQSGSNGAVIRSAASQVGVAVSADTQAPDVAVAAGSKLSGTIECPGQGTKDSCSVDVTVFSRADGETKPNVNSVVAADRSKSDGTYQITGLPAGNYWVRTNHSEDRFVAHNDAITISGDQTYNHTLSKRNFLKFNKVWFTKKGSVLKYAGTPALASLHPTERADENRYQWYRNGSPTGTGSSYRASSGTVRLCVKFGRFGFNSSDWKCSKARKV